MSDRPKLLDLFSCAGGAAVGYHRAGFDVTGVELNPDRAAHYPYRVYVADALWYLRTHADRIRDEYAAIHASPPCQASTALTKGNRARGWVDGHVDLIPETRALLDEIGLPYVIENVQGADMRRDLTLCGEMFGLGVIRHRYFELGRWTMEAPGLDEPHRGRVAGWRHGEWFDGPYFAVYGDGGGKGSVAQWQAAMGIDWIDERVLLAEAIPPAYTTFVGESLHKVALSHLTM